jgi:hypothetical protein
MSRSDHDVPHPGPKPVLSDDEFAFWSEAAFCFVHQGSSALAAAREADAFLLEALKRHPEGLPHKKAPAEDMLKRYVEALESLQSLQSTGVVGVVKGDMPT